MKEQTRICFTNAPSYLGVPKCKFCLLVNYCKVRRTKKRRYIYWMLLGWIGVLWGLGIGLISENVLIVALGFTLMFIGAVCLWKGVVESVRLEGEVKE